MSDAPVQTRAGLEAQPPMPVRGLHNLIYCPRLFYFQWVENIFQEPSTSSRPGSSRNFPTTLSAASPSNHAARTTDISFCGPTC
jgi:hypothetical protein